MLKTILGLGSSAFGLKGMAIAGGLALAVGFASGIWVRGAFCDAAAAQAQVRALARQLEAAQVAGFNDAARAQEAAGLAAELEARIDELQISDGVCLPGPDADNVRGLWAR